MESLLLLTFLSAFRMPLLGFGTSTTFFDNNAEHERITKASLACAEDVVSAECFSPECIRQLAGHLGTFGAVGNPDNPVAWRDGWPNDLEPRPAHCDMADYFDDDPDYPQSREQATTVLKQCITHIRGRFDQAVEAAGGILDANGFIIPDQVEIPSVLGCSMGSEVASNNAKCSAILAFDRALHGLQGFYSHSTWADEADPDLEISVTNPPGLANTRRMSFLDLRVTAEPNIPRQLSTGCWQDDDESPGVGICKDRITHNTLNKDGGEIDPVTGTAQPNGDTPDKGPRGDIGTNFERAVAIAILETRRQWRSFRDAMVEAHGEVGGARIICAMTRDDPAEDCNGRKVAIMVDSSGSNADTDPANLRISAATQINAALVSAAEAAAGGAANSKPDLVTVVDFDSSARVIYPLGDPDGASFAGIDPNGGTSIASGLAAAIDEILRDTTYTTRGRSGIIVLTDGEYSNLVARAAEIWRAFASGIKVSFGFLSPVQVPVTVAKRNNAVGLRPRQATSDEILAAILETGGVYPTIDSAEAQEAFVDLVLSSGLSNLDEGSSSTPLKKGLGIVGLVTDDARYYAYEAKTGEHIDIDLQAMSGCTYEAKLLVDSGVVVATVSFSAKDTLPYRASRVTKLELSVSASGSEVPLRCVFSVQLAGAFVPDEPPSSSSSSSSSTSTMSSSYISTTTSTYTSSSTYGSMTTKVPRKGCKARRPHL